MEDSSRNFNVEKLFSWGDDLVNILLRDQRNLLNDLTHDLQQKNSLSSTCDFHFNDARSLLQDHQRKIEADKQKIDEARSETVADEELELLQRELEEELEKERLLKEELRSISNECDDLERQRVSVEEQEKTSLKIEQNKRKTQMILSTYASVTKIIPDLNDPSKISGYIVEKDKNTVEKFEYDTSKMTSLDVCNDIWKNISA